MKTKFLIATSALALTVSTAAISHADMSKDEMHLKAGTTVEGQIESDREGDMHDTPSTEAIDKRIHTKNTARVLGTDVTVVEDIVVYDDSAETTTISDAKLKNKTKLSLKSYDEAKINPDMDLSKILGSKVENLKGETVGTIKDIFVDADGHAQKLVLADGELLGLGKDVVLNYSADMKKSSKGNYVLSITEADIDEMKDYDGESFANLYSLEELSETSVINGKAKTIAKVEKILFNNGHADKVVLSYDQILGMGGKRATVDFDNLAVFKAKNKNARFKLSTNQETELKGFNPSRY